MDKEALRSFNLQIQKNLSEIKGCLINIKGNLDISISSAEFSLKQKNEFMEIINCVKSTDKKISNIFSLLKTFNGIIPRNEFDLPEHSIEDLKFCQSDLVEVFDSIEGKDIFVFIEQIEELKSIFIDLHQCVLKLENKLCLLLLPHCSTEDPRFADSLYSLKKAEDDIVESKSHAPKTDIKPQIWFGNIFAHMKRFLKTTTKTKKITSTFWVLLIIYLGFKKLEGHGINREFIMFLVAIWGLCITVLAMYATPKTRRFSLYVAIIGIIVILCLAYRTDWENSHVVESRNEQLQKILLNIQEECSQGNFNNALILIDKGLSHYPYEQLLINLLKKVRKEEQESLKNLLLQADRFVNEKNFNEALQLIESEKNQYSQNVQIKLWDRQKEIKSDAAQFDFLEKTSKDMYASSLEIKKFITNKKLEDAESLFTRTHQKYPDFPYFQEIKNLLAQAKKTQDDEMLNIMISEINFFLSNKKYDDAQRLVDKAKKQFPNSSKIKELDSKISKGRPGSETPEWFIARSKWVPSLKSESQTNSLKNATPKNQIIFAQSEPGEVKFTGPLRDDDGIRQFSPTRLQLSLLKCPNGSNDINFVYWKTIKRMKIVGEPLPCYNSFYTSRDNISNISPKAMLSSGTVVYAIAKKQEGMGENVWYLVHTKDYGRNIWIPKIPGRLTYPESTDMEIVVVK